MPLNENIQSASQSQRVHHRDSPLACFELIVVTREIGTRRICPETFCLTNAKRVCSELKKDPNEPNRSALLSRNFTILFDFIVRFVSLFEADPISVEKVHLIVYVSEENEKKEKKKSFFFLFNFSLKNLLCSLVIFFFFWWLRCLVCAIVVNVLFKRKQAKYGK